MPPIAIAAGAAVASAGASAIAGSKNSKAINKATAAQTESNAASVALQKDIYGQNKGALAPFMQRGNAAGDIYNDLLGVPRQPSALGQFAGSPDVAQPNALAQFNPYANLGDFAGGQPFGSMWSPQVSQPPPATTVQANPQQSALDAYNIFKQSTGYQDRLQEGYRGVNSAFAGRGLLQSGAAQKSLLRYGQQQASGEFGNFMGYLGNQQGVGLSAASALAGVGQSYANNVTSLNSANANAIGQGAVAKANNSNQMISGIAGALGSVFGSSYG